jgi:predicted secreted Zn-dependent protease
LADSGPFSYSRSADRSAGSLEAKVGWDGYDSASPEEQKQWDSLMGGLQDHENGHKDIAEKGANDLDKSLPGTSAKGTGKNLPGAKKDADAKLKDAVTDKQKKTVNDTQAKSEKYDQKTEGGKHQERKNDPD